MINSDAFKNTSNFKDSRADDKVVSEWQIRTIGANVFKLEYLESSDDDYERALLVASSFNHEHLSSSPVQSSGLRPSWLNTVSHLMYNSDS